MSREQPKPEAEWARELVDRLIADPSGASALEYMVELSMAEPGAVERLAAYDRDLLLDLLELALGPDLPGGGR